jgi:hypothetical protein
MAGLLGGAEWRVLFELIAKAVVHAVDIDSLWHLIPMVEALVALRISPRFSA